MGSGGSGKVRHKGLDEFVRIHPHRGSRGRQVPKGLVGGRQPQKVHQDVRRPRQERRALEPRPKPVPPLGDTDHLAAVHQDLTGPSAGEAHQAAPPALIQGASMDRPANAQVGKRRSPDLTHPPGRPTYIVIPQPVPSGHQEIDPDHLAGSKKDRSPTRPPPDHIDTTADNHVTLGGTQHHRRMVHLMDKYSPTVDRVEKFMAFGHGPGWPSDVPR